MKAKVLISITGLFFGTTSFGQCCPYVDPIEIIPFAPSPADSIYVVTNVTTPNLGAYLGYTISESGNQITVEACYFSGMLTALQSYTDTINLGVKPAGVYDIVFVAYQSGNETVCDYSDSNMVTASVTVNSLSIDQQQGADFGFYPNPVTNGFIYLRDQNTSESFHYKLFNGLGEVVQQGLVNSESPIDVSAFKGVYYVSISKNEEYRTGRILIF